MGTAHVTNNRRTEEVTQGFVGSSGLARAATSAEVVYKIVSA